MKTRIPYFRAAFRRRLASARRVIVHIDSDAWWTAYMCGVSDRNLGVTTCPYGADDDRRPAWIRGHRDGANAA